MKVCKRGHEFLESKKICPECSKIYRKKWYDKNRDAAKKAMINWNQTNKEKIKEYKKKWRLENPEKHRAQVRKYNQKNLEKKRNRETVYRKKRYVSDPQFKLASVLRNRLGKALKESWKSGSAIRDLGCSIDDFKTHLEKQFQPGMSWGNHNFSGWSIDHIIPLSYFNLLDREQFLIANHFLNMRPAWMRENREKFNKLPEPEILTKLIDEIKIRLSYRSVDAGART